MMKVVWFEDVAVVILLEADRDGVVIVLDRSRAREFDTKLAHTLELEDAIDLVGQILA